MITQTPEGDPFPVGLTKEFFMAFSARWKSIDWLAGWPHPRGSEPLARPAGRRDISGGFPASLQRLPKAVGH